VLKTGARWIALENEDFCLSTAQEERHCKTPCFAISALSSPVLAGSRKEWERIHAPSRLGKGAKQHPGDDGFAHFPPENEQKDLILHK